MEQGKGNRERQEEPRLLVWSAQQDGEPRQHDPLAGGVQIREWRRDGTIWRSFVRRFVAWWAAQGGVEMADGGKVAEQSEGGVEHR